MAAFSLSRWRVAAFLVSGGIVSAVGLTYAYAVETKALSDGPQQPWLAVAVIFSGLTQLGSTGLLVKKYMAKVDVLAETSPVLLATLDAHKSAMEANTRHIEELFNSRNDHSDNLTEINTLHDVKGCKNLKAPARRKKKRTPVPGGDK